MEDFFKNKVKFLSIYTAYFILVLTTIGWFCLSAQTSTFLGIALISISSFIIISLLKHRFKSVNKILWLAPFLFYYIITLISWKLILNPVLPSLIMAYLALYLNIHFAFKFIIGLPIAFYIINFGYSNEIVTNYEEKLPTHNLHDFIFFNDSSETILFSKGNCYIIETYAYGCGSCISAIKDLEPYFKDLEIGYKMKYEYVYVGNIKDKEKTITWLNKYCHPTKNSFISNNNNYYTKTEMLGNPYFNFYDKNGDYLVSYAGYFNKHKKRYIRKFNKLLKCHCQFELK